MKKNATTLVILLIIIFLFTGCSKTLARADGIEVKQKEVDTYINFLIKSQDTTGEIASDEEKLNDLKVSIIDMLIVIKLLEKYAEENNIIVTNLRTRQCNCNAASSCTISGWSSEGANLPRYPPIFNFLFMSSSIATSSNSSPAAILFTASSALIFVSTSICLIYKYSSFFSVKQTWGMCFT